MAGKWLLKILFFSEFDLFKCLESLAIVFSGAFEFCVFRFIEFACKIAYSDGFIAELACLSGGSGFSGVEDRLAIHHG